MANVIDQVADYLAVAGIGVGGVNIFIGFLPQSPDTALSISPTGGFPADGKNGYDEPTFQVYTRAATYIAAVDKANAVYAALQGMHNVTLSEGTYVVNCLALQSAPELIGRDEQERIEFSQNFRIRVRNKTTHRV